MKSCVGIVGNF